MNKYYLTLCIMTLFFFGACSGQQSSQSAMAEVKTLDTELQKVSYGLGSNIATNIKQQGFKDIDLNSFVQAMKDVMAGNDLLLSEEESMKVVNEFFQKKQAEQSTVSKAEGEQFLADNKSKDGVVTLDSGMQYVIMKEGNGPKPGLDDKVTTHYHGTLIDGTVFDSSVDRGQPASFPVSGVIKGWTEALQLMPVGSKWKLFIPSDLAYGERGAGGNIGPNSALVFEVELLSIDK